MEVHEQDIIFKKQEEAVVWQTQPTHDEAELAFRVYKMLDGNEAFSNVSEFHVVPVQGEDGSIVSIHVTGIQRDEDDSQTLQTQVFELQDLEETLHPQIEQSHQEVSVQFVSPSEDQPAQCEGNQSTIQEYESQSVSTAVPEATSEPEHSRTPPSETTELAGVKTLYRCAECSFTSFNLTALRRHMRRHSDKYKCHLCEKTFGSTTELRLHVNVHLGIRPHKCKECDMAYGTAADLLRHTRSAHTLEKPFQCCYCDYASVEANRMKVHIRSHTGERPYVCSQCPFATTDAFKLRRHMRTHTGEKPYTCHLCQAKFTQNTSMKMHILRKHTENLPKEHCPICNVALFGKNYVQVHIRKQHTYLETPLKCRFCPETFHERYILRQHQLSHRVEMQVGVKSGKKNINPRGNKVDGQASETEKDGIAWSIVPANGETQLFLIDGDQSGTVTELHSIPMHAEDGSIVQAIVVQSAEQVDTAVYEVQDIGHVLQPLVVPHAPEPVIISTDPSITQPTQSGEEQSVTPESKLQETDPSEAQVMARKGKRIQLVHPEAQIEVKLHRCKDCEKAFVTGMELLKHKKMHKSENLFKCPFCEHEATEAVDLIVHVQIHNDNRPFSCSQCSFATTDAFKLSRHTRTHTGEKPFTCSVCQATFTQKTSMEMHVLRKHTKELPKLHCPICNTILTGKHSLKIHIRKQHSHSETELKCRFCPETFHERFVFRQHQKAHRNEKSVRSNVSGISCKRKREMKETGMEKHQTTIHLLENEPMTHKTQEQEFAWQVLPTDQETEVHFVISETEDTNTVTGYHVLPMHTEDGSIISIQLAGLQEMEQVDVGALAQVFLAKDV